MSTDDPSDSRSPPSRARKQRRAVALPDGRIQQPSGGWIRPHPKGVPPANITRAERIRQIRRMGRDRSPELMQRLIDIGLHDPDTRVAAVAIREAFLWTYGKPEDVRPDESESRRPLDASKLTDRELAILAKLVESDRFTDAPEPSEPPEIDGVADGPSAK